MLQFYDLGEFVAAKEIHGGLANSNYRVETTKGVVLLKIMEEKTVPQILLQIEVLLVLKKNKFPAAFPVAQKNGDYLLLFNNLKVVCFDFLPVRWWRGSFCENLI